MLVYPRYYLNHRMIPSITLRLHKSASTLSMSHWRIFDARFIEDLQNAQGLSGCALHMHIRGIHALLSKTLSGIFSRLQSWVIISCRCARRGHLHAHKALAPRTVRNSLILNLSQRRCNECYPVSLSMLQLSLISLNKLLPTVISSYIIS